MSRRGARRALIRLWRCGTNRRFHMHTLWQDVRFGLRMLIKHRIATMVCVLALALGIGANTAIFSLAEAFLLHPVPFENVSRIVARGAARPQGNVDMRGVA